ncbi:unnamed protein product [Tilletia controversa]|uniref:Fungal-type protein kinase domain-containing protein n=1 Tax=Tilletia caries TaxID=13290 RepID=A0ABN7IVL7_9BASI|nr:hypothetical protein CF335_g4299 [Tilletia laevis]CAD6888494.1 unnamed protein product [Tilletia caries]CAD6909779.1 unnamed protein product [Tilletia controversa]CAD6913811.1 unnamed protein product [Tilletia caries]CAD6923889.1 unnamed protein product [Tilletia caries]
MFRIPLTDFTVRINTLPTVIDTLSCVRRTEYYWTQRGLMLLLLFDGDPFSYRTDYYRVLRPQATPPPSSTQVAQSSQSRLGQSTSSTQTSETQSKVRLQRLPVMFRPKVMKTAIWEDPDDEECFNLFDHMGRGPRLKFM